MHFSADSHSTPHFSLLVTTRNRRGPFIRLLESLVVQKYPYFTVLLGDQNPPQFLADILQHYSTKLDIDYRLITPKGLSAARNQLLPHVKGDIVALTDDDCHYSPDTLLKVANFFQQAITLRVALAHSPKNCLHLHQSEKHDSPCFEKHRHGLFF